MTVPKSDLSNIQSGDYIWTIQLGWAKVTIKPDNTYKITVKHPSYSGYTYTSDGKHHLDNLHPSAWPFNPFNPDEQPPQDFKPGEVIAVRDNKEYPWSYDKFEIYNKDEENNYICEKSCWKYARKLIPEERGE